MECNYHKIIEGLNEVIWDRIDSYYDWEMFRYWLGDESELGEFYVDVFEEILQTQLTEENRELIKKKGYNLEVMIGKWCAKWKSNHPETENEKLPSNCLKIKINEYIINQMNKPDILAIIGSPC